MTKTSYWPSWVNIKPKGGSKGSVQLRLLLQLDIKSSIGSIVLYTVYTLLSMVSVSVHSTHTQCPANPKSYVLLMTTGDNYITIFIWIHNDNIGSLLREMPAQTKLNSDLVLSGFNLFTGIQRPKPKPCSIANMLKSSSPHPETLAEGRSKIRDAKTHQVMSPDITTNKPTFIMSLLLS